MAQKGLRIISPTDLFLVSVFFFLQSTITGQPPQFKIYNYIEANAGEAVHQMAVYKIPASVILAQAIFESACGTSELAKRSNNHFGIKCHSTWAGDTTVKTDDAEDECFRKYGSVKDSYTDHSVFLVSRPRYSELFKLPFTDYKGWCRGLKNAGYATYPTYAEELIRIIEQNNLYVLDGPDRLETGIYLSRKEPEIQASQFTAFHFKLPDFSQFGMLWIDERDILIQSLELVIDHDDGIEEIVEK
jgi:hypothetical protein